MSRAEILAVIEHLRAEMYSLAPVGGDYAEMLEVSQLLDEFIVMFYEVAT